MRPALTLAAALTLLVGCADGGAEPSAGTSPAAPTTATAAGSAAPTTSPAPGATEGTPVSVPDALQFSAPLVGGGTLDMAAYAGTTVALWFWAPT